LAHPRRGGDPLDGDVFGPVLVCYGMMGAPPVLDLAKVIRNGLRIVGCGGPGWFHQVIGVHYPEILVMAAEGRTEPRVADVLPLADAAEAHRRIEEGTAIGKTIRCPDRVHSELVDGLLG
jgi:NADPH:quinone reductase